MTVAALLERKQIHVRETRDIECSMTKNLPVKAAKARTLTINGGQ